MVVHIGIRPVKNPEISIEAIKILGGFVVKDPSRQDIQVREV